MQKTNMFINVQTTTDNITGLTAVACVILVELHLCEIQITHNVNIVTIKENLINPMINKYIY